MSIFSDAKVTMCEIAFWMAWLSAEKMLVKVLKFEVLLFSTKANNIPLDDFEASVKIFMRFSYFSSNIYEKLFLIIEFMVECHT